MPDDVNTTQPEKGPKKVEDIFDFEEKREPAVPQAQPEIKGRPPEVTKEVIPEVKPGRPPEVEEEAARRKYAPPPAKPAVPPVTKSEEYIKVENILSEHLDELFLQMTPQQQMTFQQKGEETAGKIEKLLQETKIKVKEILDLIKEWLKLIPGINKFFLEQEAKIKTDRLINLREQKHKQK